MVHSIGLTLSFLCSPIAWPGYTIFLIPVFLSNRWKIIHKVVAIVLSIPVLMMFNAVDKWRSFRIPISWMYGFAILLLFGVTVYEAMNGRQSFSSNKPLIDITRVE